MVEMKAGEVVGAWNFDQIDPQACPDVLEPSKHIVSDMIF